MLCCCSVKLPLSNRENQTSRCLSEKRYVVGGTESTTLHFSKSIHSHTQTCAHRWILGILQGNTDVYVSVEYSDSTGKAVSIHVILTRLIIHLFSWVKTSLWWLYFMPVKYAKLTHITLQFWECYSRAGTNASTHANPPAPKLPNCNLYGPTTRTND